MHTDARATDRMHDEQEEREACAVEGTESALAYAAWKAHDYGAYRASLDRQLKATQEFRKQR